MLEKTFFRNILEWEVKISIFLQNLIYFQIFEIVKEIGVSMQQIQVNFGRPFLFQNILEWYIKLSTLIYIQILEKSK